MSKVDEVLQKLEQAAAGKGKELLALLVRKFGSPRKLGANFYSFEGDKTTAKAMYDLARKNGWQEVPTRKGDLFMVTNASKGSNIIFWAKGKIVEVTIK